MFLFLLTPLKFAAYDRKCYYTCNEELERSLKVLKHSCALTLINSFIKTISYYQVGENAVWMEALNIFALLVPLFYAKEILLRYQTKETHKVPELESWTKSNADKSECAVFIKH